MKFIDSHGIVRFDPIYIDQKQLKRLVAWDKLRLAGKLERPLDEIPVTVNRIMSDLSIYPNKKNQRMIESCLHSIGWIRQKPCRRIWDRVERWFPPETDPDIAVGKK